MSDLKGTSRMPTSFITSEDADPRLQSMLTLYKQPATIRDMKQVYFYASVEADLTTEFPLLHQYGIDLPTFDTPSAAGFRVDNPYYSRIGTERHLDIRSVVHNLLDIRVPDDKYVFEINLAECTIEADPNNWRSLPDRVLRMGPSLIENPPIVPENPPQPNGLELNMDPTYTWESGLDSTPEPPPPGYPPAEPPRFIIASRLTQATKLSTPQTLYVKIKELDNGEPYNWSVTNSGVYSIDKGHQLLVRHGNIDYSKLTLQFGHLVFKGNDQEYERFLFDQRKVTQGTAEQQLIKAQNTGLKLDEQSSHNYGKYEFFDYNSEIFNVNGQLDFLINPSGRFSPNLFYSNLAYRPLYETPSFIYPRVYNGEDHLFQFANGNPTVNDNVGNNTRNLVRPANRPPFYFRGIWDENNDTRLSTIPDPSQEADARRIYQDTNIMNNNVDYNNQAYLLQGKPLLFNQQAHKINFRFLVRVIHTF